MWPQRQDPKDQHTWSQLQGDPSHEGNSAALVSFISGLCCMSILLSIFAPAALSSNSFLTSASSYLKSSAIIWAIVIVLIFIAIITGHIGLAEARHYDPKRAWRIFAILGLVLGYLPALAFVTLLVIILYSFRIPLR